MTPIRPRDDSHRVRGAPTNVGVFRSAEGLLNAAGELMHPRDAPLTQAFGSGWVYEVKYDGFRGRAAVLAGDVALRGRGGGQFLERFPEITAALRRLKHDVVLDGEIVAFDA